jgi:hypothetical protein
MGNQRWRQPRLDFEALVRAAGEPRSMHNNTGVPAPITSLAEKVGVQHRTLLRWRNEGGVPLSKADGVAIALGRHPVEVWGIGAWLAAVHEYDRREHRVAA